MDRHAVALVLEEIATLLRLGGANPFKANAYAGAARAIADLEDDLVVLQESGGLRDVPGVGSATAAVIEELLTTGRSSLHQELREQTPSVLFAMLAIPGLGEKRVRTIHSALGVGSLDELEAAGRAGRIAELAGFGPKTEASILEGIAFVRGMAGRRIQSSAFRAAAGVIAGLEAHPDVEQVRMAGELRRRLEAVDGVELVVGASETPGSADQQAGVIETFLATPGLSNAEMLEATEGESGVGLRARGELADGFAVSMRSVPPADFPTAWLHATGSEAHLAALVEVAREQGLELRPDGLRRDGERVEVADEEAIYSALGLPWIAPELREDGSEVRAASAGELPELVESSDLRGCFHNHTTFSDGAATLREMAEAAIALGWRYLGIADHSRAAAYAGGLTPADVRRQQAEIDAWNAEHGERLWLFKGIEADILADGTLDFSGDDGVLATFDYVVGSVHSSFGLSEADQTARVLRALENPHLTFLGHATGRLLLSRDGYALDIEAVLSKAAEEGVGIEINANPRRLELDWRHWRRARELGIRTAINPDAHSPAELENVEYGVGVARKGWLTPGDVVNAWTLEDVTSYFEGKNT